MTSEETLILRLAHYDGANGETIRAWLAAGELPTLEDALKRLDYLSEHGPSDHGWSLKKPLDQPTD